MTSAVAITDLRTREHLATQVLVVGGGAAGVATAITAGRQGLQVTLLERYGFCGGGVVAGMSGTICGMFLASNNTESKPAPLVHGFAGEFAQRMTAAGGRTPPVRYGKSFSLVHDPLVWRSVANAMLADAGVRVLLHTLVTDVLLDGGERVAGVQVGVRETRQIDGVATLANDDVVAGTKFATGIARSAWPIEMHTGVKPRLTWLIDDFYEIPYECFVPQRGESLLAAVRCLSAQHEAMGSARVTARCFSYGHAIGHAAALAVRERTAPRQIDGAALRNILNRYGAGLGTALPDQRITQTTRAPQSVI